jgi:L-glutamine-phosphate cytidylyltransferase
MPTADNIAASHRGLILAAGRGSRLGDMTEDQPKGLVPLGGHSLIDWQIAALRAAEISDIAIATGYRGSLLAARGLTCFENPHWSETNMVMSLAGASAWLEQQPCIVSYADIFYAPDDLASLVSTTADIAVAYDPDWLALWSSRFDDPLDDAETFRMKGDRLVEIGQKPSSVDQVEGQYMGLLRFSPVGWATIASLLDALPDDIRDRLDMTSLLQRLLDQDTPIGVCPISNGWGEVDHQSDLEFYERELAAGKFPWAEQLAFET